jgi:uncharacterized protein with GYD domain
MPTYVTLIHYTEQGVKTLKDLPQRLEDTRKAGEAIGAKLVSFYLTMGQYDTVVVSGAPDDQTVAALALAAAARGNVRTETLRASPRTRPRASAPAYSYCTEQDTPLVVRRQRLPEIDRRLGQPHPGPSPNARLGRSVRVWESSLPAARALIRRSRTAPYEPAVVAREVDRFVTVVPRSIGADL